jgi:hypothetical protein
MKSDVKDFVGYYVVLFLNVNHCALSIVKWNIKYFRISRTGSPTTQYFYLSNSITKIRKMNYCYSLHSRAFTISIVGQLEDCNLPDFRIFLFFHASEAMPDKSNYVGAALFWLYILAALVVTVMIIERLSKSFKKQKTI